MFSVLSSDELRSRCEKWNENSIDFCIIISYLVLLQNGSTLKQFIKEFNETYRGKKIDINDLWNWANKKTIPNFLIQKLAILRIARYCKK